ncbi:MAG: two pore domain potassium channel family protein [Chloroflexi bacterium]|nr:two pore domain potassium channel family protein [Chloroflexota bacterium]
MSLLSVVEAIVGCAIVVLILNDVFQSVVVPRRTSRVGRPGSYVVRSLWSVWLRVAFRLESNEQREALLGTAGATAVIILLVFWLASLIVGYGLIFDAFRDQVHPAPATVFTSMYFAGTSMLTIGFGDLAPVGGAARFVSLVAGATGLGLFALVISFLFTLYGAFQRREVAVVVLEAAAGAPPSGVTLLETYALAGILDDLPRVFETWQAWAADVLDSHLAYPVLAYFRSSHDNDSWVSSLGAVMDAGTLVLTTMEGGPKGWAKLSHAVGGHCLEDLVQYFGLPDPQDGPQVERAEFEDACDRLEKAGFELRDRDEAWERFSHVRGRYANRVNSLARFWATPPAQWIGDRSPMRNPSWHQAAIGPGASRLPVPPPPAATPTPQPPAAQAAEEPSPVEASSR